MFSSPRGGVAWEKWFSNISWWSFWLVKGFWTHHSFLLTLVFLPMRWGNNICFFRVFFRVSFLPPYQEQLKTIRPVEHWTVLGVRWSFWFKALFYPNLIASSSSLQGSLLSTLPVFWSRERWAERDGQNSFMGFSTCLLPFPNWILKLCQTFYLSNRAGIKWL